MTKINWKFFISRKRKTLSQFLKNANSVEEAYKIIDQKGLTRPDHDLVVEAVAEAEELRQKKIEDAKNAANKLLPPNPTTPRSRKKKNTRSKNETSKSSSDKEEENESGKKYFRKVVPNKKSKK